MSRSAPLARSGTTPCARREAIGPVPAHQHEFRFGRLGQHQRNRLDELRQSLVGFEASAVQDDARVRGDPQLLPKRQGTGRIGRHRVTREAPLPHRGHRRDPAHTLREASAADDIVRPGEQPPLGRIKRLPDRRHPERPALLQLLGQARLHVVQQRDAVTPREHRRRERRLLECVNAGIPLATKEVSEGTDEADIEEQLLRREPDRHLRETEGVGRPQDPKPGKLDVLADRKSQEIHPVAQLAQRLQHLSQGDGGSPVLVERLRGHHEYPAPGAICKEVTRRSVGRRGSSCVDNWAHRSLSPV